MKRRQALLGITLLSAGSVAFSSYKWLSWYKKPDLVYVHSQKELLAALAETIIPTTDTPGAIEAGVPDFILKMVVENTMTASQNRFIDGLKAVDPYAINRFGKPYVKCTRDQQNEVMRHFENAGKPFEGIPGKVERKLIGNSFFTTLKQYTCVGYFTSRLGATRSLAYVFTPGGYTGCVPLITGQKSWAIR
ncbi:gluconate 2-dehydrogenase subunit 3 family protein [Larkinella knui]|uniref:Gluconate 2-dehydrogenase subunit 3 family protein n=1 Tax=Larkinella knui TaxID=2025310 RepID=A0A3P1CTU3_9BACT|nr:gluconate 2-dehydrogenase subunit 3 family protein [Larkinella knui]RRB16743.1 gluconate 2-dehydrogenase subunit 3 family protein [Larkinella knui]